MRLFSTEAECSVLGALLLGPEKFWEISLHEDDFHGQDHKLIYRAIAHLSAADKTIDAVTVGEWLIAENLLDATGGAGYLARITTETPTAGNIKSYEKIVKDYSIRRLGIKTFQTAISRIEHEDPSIVLAEAQAELDSVRSGSYSDFQAILKAVHERMENAGRGLIGVPWGVPAIDEYIGGFEGPKLVIVAGRPSVGKTALCLQGSINGAMRHGLGFGFISLETNEVETGARMMAHLTQTNLSGIMRGTDNVCSAVSKNWRTEFDGLPIWMDSQTFDLPGIISRINEWHRKYDIKSVIIDYLQLVDHKGTNRNEIIGEVTRALKINAKRTGIPHIVVSQLSRDLEKTSRLPVLADLRDSGNIEQDADIAIFLHSAIETDEHSERGASLGILKNKVGRTVWLKDAFKFNGRTQTLKQMLSAA